MYVRGGVVVVRVVGRWLSAVVVRMIGITTRKHPSKGTTFRHGRKDKPALILSLSLLPR